MTAGTRQIPLTQGKFAIVDAEDYARLSRHKWRTARNCNNFYARREENGVTIGMHREILKPPAGLICDHKDHNGLNNSRSNLRVCTNAENARNQRPQKGRSSRYKGVGWHKRNKKWQAQIRFNGGLLHLGLFDSQIVAAVAYDRKAEELFGEFACLNFPQLIEFRFWLKKLIWAA